jgi:hypothetical protein
MSKRDLERYTDAELQGELVRRLKTQPELEPPQLDGLGLEIAPYFFVPRKEKATALWMVKLLRPRMR